MPRTHRLPLKIVGPTIWKRQQSIPSMSLFEAASLNVGWMLYPARQISHADTFRIGPSARACALERVSAKPGGGILTDPVLRHKQTALGVIFKGNSRGQRIPLISDYSPLATRGEWRARGLGLTATDPGDGPITQRNGRRRSRAPTKRLFGKCWQDW